MRGGLVILMLGACLLAGCVSPEHEKDRTIAVAKAHCENEGKQFVLKDVDQEGIANVTHFSTTVSGVCLGPHDPGYVAPKPIVSTSTL
jgi:hypothetical protein